VFRELDRSQRPLPVPFEFGVDTKSSGDCSAVSPLPEDLLALADRVVALGRACVSGDPTYLPADCLSSSNHTKPTTTEDIKSAQNDHCQSLSWQGWNDRQFGLEMQSPWAGLLLQGRKTIETRAYDLPPALLGKRIEILQSKQGSTVSSLGNVVRIAEEDPAVTRAGWCRFTHVVRYNDFALFDADQDAHWVTKESDFYPFKKGSKTNVVYGWVVGEVGLSTNETCSLPLKAIVRRYRSLFELNFDTQTRSKWALHLTRTREKSDEGIDCNIASELRTYYFSCSRTRHPHQHGSGLEFHRKFPFATSNVSASKYDLDRV
jgi:hypothetical protein